jgi:hypothetical protein
MSYLIRSRIDAVEMLGELGSLAEYLKANIALIRPALIVSQAHSGDTHSADLSHQI